MNKTIIIFIALLISTITSCSSLLGVKTKTDKPQPDITTKSVRYTSSRPIDLNKFEIEIFMLEFRVINYINTHNLGRYCSYIRDEDEKLNALLKNL